MKLTVFQVLERARDGGYAPPMGLSLLIDGIPREKMASEGLQLVAHMEADRVNIFKACYGDDWKFILQDAHEMIVEGKAATTIELLQEVLDAKL